MNNEQLKEILENQLKLLAERSNKSVVYDEVCRLTHAMTEIVPLIQSLSDDGLVSYPVRVQMSIQDLTDLYQGRHMSQQKMLSGN